jgi:hypothetical protein
MDRNLFRHPSLTRTQAPPFSCPRCNKGQLRLVRDSLSDSQTATSRKNQSFDESGPEDREYTFGAALECNERACQETVRVTGKGSPEPTEAYDEDGPFLHYEDSFKPLFFHPGLVLFQPPKSTPLAVVAQLGRSFQLFFCDPSAAANRLRSAIECLLTELRVPRSSSGGRSSLLSLHHRILKVPKKYKAHTDLFLAVKWIGNAGSHRADLSADDVLDGFEITEHVLTELYDNKAGYVRTIAKQINQRKGPRRVDSRRKLRRAAPKQ